ncbi:MAG TPA: hypothetical protein DCY79_17310 [Planctomycetaceae bacterium]|nr:hypothetical protein [Blastopirellula sp.]HAY81564.1 hypothetical protein [Planctomycetaceae bacterium]
MQGPDRSPTLLIIGASVRSAIESAKRANVCARGADLFADVDAVQQASVTRVTNYPGGFLPVVRSVAPAAVVYTGGLENYPELIAEISQSTLIWGNSAAVLRAVRSPENLVQAWTEDQVQHPAILRSPPTDPNRRWLQKSVTSTAGTGVRDWQPGSPVPEDCYLQQFIPGRSCAALYVAAQGRCQLLGVTEQLVDRSWTGAPRFGYAGSIGPLSLEPSIATQCVRIGDCLAARFPLRGLFGVDVIVQEDHVYPVEVNPRYTASVEVWERATGVAALEWHQRACQETTDGVPFTLPDRPLSGATSNVPPQRFGKAILFADRPCPVSSELVALLASQQLADGQSAFSDIPHPGQLIQTGHPVTTVWAQGPSVNEVEALLAQRVAELRQRLADDHSVAND